MCPSPTGPPVTLQMCCNFMPSTTRTKLILHAFACTMTVWKWQIKYCEHKSSSLSIVSWVFFKRCHLSKKYKIGQNGWHVSRWKQDCFDLSWAQMTRVRSFTENNIPCIAQKQHLSNNLTLEPSHSSTLLILWNQYGSCVLHVCRNPEQFYALCF